MNTQPLRRALATVALAALFLVEAAAPRALASEVPDLTQGDERPAKAIHDWALGATGLRGWMHAEKMVTSDARQILVTEVAPGSPADGVLRVGDVILGVGGQPFSSDPRTEFGRALSLAESGDGKGRLSLRRWRAGEAEVVTLNLPVLGDYGATAPYDCPKSARILEAGCAALAKSMTREGYSPNPIPRCLNALALLASEDPVYKELIQREAKWAADYSATSFQTWYYGYVCIFLSEYMMATGDRSVEDGLWRLALDASEGQSRVGSWGHKFAQPGGRLLGYGMMNSPGVPLTIGLVLARSAGVEDKKVDVAIDRSLALLRFYVGKGAIPYGDHHPWIQTHEDNGKCGMGAVLFDLVGEAESAHFYSLMSLASHGAERDTGHTGNFFNLLWALPGASRLGEHATGAWMQEFGAWYFDLARQWDGTFRHQGPPEDRRDSYANWDATGAYLLAYALPLRSLVLTGKTTAAVASIDAEEAAAIIHDGRGWDNRDRVSYYRALKDEELLRRSRSWSPIVRERAAIAMARRATEFVPAMVEQLSSPSRVAQYGACQAFTHFGGAGAPAVAALEACFSSDDLWLRVKAAEALGKIGKGAMSAVPALLERLAVPPTASDRRAMEQRYLCFTLFDRRGGMLRHSLEDVDQEALHAAIRAGLKNEDGRARSAVGNIYDSLRLDSLKPLLPAIYEATMHPAPSGIMFADGVRMSGLRLFAKHRIEEGVGACVHYVRHQKPHASEKRTPEVLEILKGYGAHGQRYLKDLEAIAEYFENDEPDFPKRLSLGKAQAVREAMAAIEASTHRPDLISIQ